LNKLTLNKTTIVIAHRLSTILNSNKIYVMDKGMVLDSGSHEELLLKSETYKDYYNKQINKS
jgi:subfamily B ATP-binding cassette protein MsbA